jgi:hypothetical protein
MILVMLAFAAYFIIAAFTVKTFKYKYGGYRVPRLAGGIIYAGLGVLFFWIALVFAGKP